MKRLLIALCWLTLPLVAEAQVTQKGKNGGAVVDSAGHYIEMISNGTELVFILTEGDGSPIKADGKTARAVIQQDGKTVTVQLSPDEPNKLIGTLSDPLKRGARIVVSTTLSDKHVVQGRFVKD